MEIKIDSTLNDGAPRLETTDSYKYSLEVKIPDPNDATKTVTKRIPFLVDWSDIENKPDIGSGNISGTANYIPKFTSANSIGNGWQAKDIKGASHCDWKENTYASGHLITLNTLAYWNGAYNASNNSNLKYCVKGEIASMTDLPGVATSTTLGLVKIGFAETGKKYAVKLDSNNKMYVEVPWSAGTSYNVVSTTENGLAPKLTTTNSFMVRVGSENNPTWQTITVIDGGNASTTNWGTITK